MLSGPLISVEIRLISCDIGIITSMGCGSLPSRWKDIREHFAFAQQSQIGAGLSFATAAFEIPFIRSLFTAARISRLLR